MNLSLIFFINSILLGIGLAMDAFSVSMANGLNEPGMLKSRMCKISSVYAIFQFIMPLLGWIFVHKLITYFKIFEKFIPWIALILLLYIGIEMLTEGISNKDTDNTETYKLGLKKLLIQGLATSIDALSVGFTIAQYNFIAAFLASVIIGLITFAICLAGLYIGKKVGTKIAGKATILGGIILIGIGLEIFIKGLFF